jgi:hypothetical protein
VGHQTGLSAGGRVVMESAYCREKAQKCLEEARRLDVPEDQRECLLWMADQWLELADALESLDRGPEPASLPDNASTLH